MQYRSSNANLKRTSKQTVAVSYSAATEAQKGLYLRSYPYRRYNKLILVSF